MKKTNKIIITLIALIGVSIFYSSLAMPNAQKTMKLAEEAKALTLDLKEDGYSIEKVEEIVSSSYSKLDVFVNKYERQIIIASKQSNGERKILFRVDFE